MTVLLAVRGESFVVLGADRRSTLSYRDAAGHLHQQALESSKLLAVNDPPFVVATAGWGILSGSSARCYVAELIRQELDADLEETARWLRVAQKLQLELSVDVAANGVTSRESLTVLVGLMEGGPRLIRIGVATDADATAGDVVIVERAVAAPTPTLKPYFAALDYQALIRDGSDLTATVGHVNRMVAGAIAEEERLLGDLAEVAGPPEIAAVDGAGARLIT